MSKDLAFPEDSVSLCFSRSRPVPAAHSRGVAWHVPCKRLCLGEVRRGFDSDGTTWVTVFAPSSPVSVAPFTACDCSATTEHRADSIGHIDTYLSVVPRPVRAGAGRSTTTIPFGDGGP
jgi:hypothetical protein